MAAAEAKAVAVSSFQELKTLHFDSRSLRFLDYGNHSEDVALQVTAWPTARLAYRSLALMYHHSTVMCCCH